MSEFEQARQAKTIHQAALLRRENVVGVGVGIKTGRNGSDGALSVVVLVRHKLPPAALRAEALVPPEVDGVRTDVLEVGDLRALAGFTARQRPAPGGVSIGHYQVTAGTLGGMVRDRQTGRRLILSNNHVLANCNQARPGDPILQPGPADGGRVGPDTLACLERFVRLRFNEDPPASRIVQVCARYSNWLARLVGSGRVLQALQGGLNRVDAALARPLDQADLQDQALEIGPVCGLRPAELGLAVCKAGRTTAFTQGTIRVLDAAVTVGYGPNQTAAFEGQIVSTPMSEGGDSGSLLVSAQGRQAVGLLFAGSGQASLFNPIQAVLEALRVELPGVEPAPQQVTARLSAPSLAAQAQVVRQVRTGELLRKANVVGVGVGYRRRGGQVTSELGLVALVRRKLPPEQLAPEDCLPGQIDGLALDVQEVGDLHQIPQARIEGIPQAVAQEDKGYGNQYHADRGSDQ